MRTWLADAVSPSMKHSFAAGIGLFLTFIGLVETGIVTSEIVPGLRATAPDVEHGGLHLAARIRN